MEKDKIVQRLMLHYGDFDEEKIEHIYEVLKEYFPTVLRSVEESIIMEEKVHYRRIGGKK